ncbi:MAG: DNA-binding protein WhiA [Erysipelotrichaceae bacterium]|nr:DNA-binding protein WhiA [Erysipelotrichaceae bacterium]
MSFTSTVKEEVTRLEENRLESIAELSCIIRNNATIANNIITITVENNAVARQIFKLIKNIYDVVPVITVRKRYNFNNNLSYILKIKSKAKIILKDLSVEIEGKYQNIPKDYLINDEECLRAYLRGLFIATGSINDPKTSRYHLEFIVDNLEYANYMMNLLNKFNLNSKVIKREKNYMIYIKEAEKISDFLRVINAYHAVMYFEDIRIYRDHKNMTNRLNNCEQANMDKVFLTATKQLKDIELLKKYDLIDVIDPKLKEVVEYREKYPESSLQELSEIMSEELGYPITKSGLNHRFRKLKEIVRRIEDK